MLYKYICNIIKQCKNIEKKNKLKKIHCQYQFNFKVYIIDNFNNFFIIISSLFLLLYVLSLKFNHKHSNYVYILHLYKYIYMK